ncbi:MAG TPA: enoyl-CoA hydratase/isomerase family protein, partial [Candidatus Saccharimonadales bacterium]|nr:enoyl-CoA hydratase/isomerase family protein [Candidatus Saccharimonadales bacterium]
STLRALRAAFLEAGDDDRVGVVVLTGAGDRAFSTGADLAEQEAFLERPNDYWSWMGSFIDAIDAIRGCPKPTIARLNGMVVGGGNELNLACDLAVAADDIAIRHVGPSRGSLPAGGATQWLPIVVGDRRAREILFLNRPILAPKALEWGLVNEAVPRAQLDPAVDDLSHELLAKLPATLRATKAWTHFWKDLSWSLTIRPAREWLTVHAASQEVRAGLESFRQKRLPDYEALREATVAAGRASGSPELEIDPDLDPQPRRCAHCGRGPFAAELRYCGYCGARIALGDAQGGASAEAGAGT